ncbi:MAG: nitroreductase family protein [Bacilli bacterium]|jgi:nitroreductase
MELSELMKKRQSVRSFEEKPVSEEDLKMILESAYNAPIGRASYGRYELVVVNDKEKIKHLSTLLSHASAILKNTFFDAPLVIFVTGKPLRDRLDGCDTGCLIENMMLMAASLNLGSCFLYTISEVINGDIALKRAFNLQDGYSVMSAVVIGHPKQKDLPNKVRPGIKTTFLN